MLAHCHKRARVTTFGYTTVQKINGEGQPIETTKKNLRLNTILQKGEM